MDELLPRAAFMVFRLIFGIAFEVMFLKIFYLIGMAPVWLLTLGHYPKRGPEEMDRLERVLYASLGVALTIAIGWYGFSSDTFLSML